MLGFMIIRCHDRCMLGFGMIDAMLYAKMYASVCV